MRASELRLVRAGAQAEAALPGLEPATRRPGSHLRARSHRQGVRELRCARRQRADCGRAQRGVHPEAGAARRHGGFAARRRPPGMLRPWPQRLGQRPRPAGAALALIRALRTAPTPPSAGAVCERLAWPGEPQVAGAGTGWRLPPRRPLQARRHHAQAALPPQGPGAGLRQGHHRRRRWRDSSQRRSESQRRRHLQLGATAPPMRTMPERDGRVRLGAGAAGAVQPEAEG